MKKQTDKLVVKVKPSIDIAQGLKCEVVSDKEIRLTAEKAFAYLELDTFQGERPVNERHVQFLYNAYSGGRFMWDHVLIACCDYAGKRYRINGQHTMWMRVNIKDSEFKDNEPMVREVIYKVDSEEQLRILYSTFDQNKTRTPAHVFKALVSGTRESADIWPSALNTLSAGLKLWLFERDRSLVSSNDLAALVHDKYQPLFRIVGLYYQSHYDDVLWIRRAAVIAALFATFEKAGGKAPDFWDPVFSGLNLTDKSDARYALRKFLETHKQSLKHDKSSMKASSEEIYRVCVLAWNKWRAGQKVAAGLRATEDRQKPR